MNVKGNNTMTLSNFIKQTIIEITNGLHEAQDETREKGTQIFPDSYIDQPTKRDIKFDLAVTQTSKDGDINLTLGVKFLNIGAENEKTSSEIINRIHIDIEVGFIVFNPLDKEAPQEGFAYSGGSLTVKNIP